MKGFKFQPAKWLTTIATVLVTAQAVAQIPPMDKTIPDSWMAWLGWVSAAVILTLGVITHKISTPLADPRDNDGNRLVPASPPVRADKTGLTP